MVLQITLCVGGGAIPILETVARVLLFITNRRRPLSPQVVVLRGGFVSSFSQNGVPQLIAQLTLELIQEGLLAHLKCISVFRELPLAI